MKHYIVFVEEYGRNDVIKYVGLDEEKAIEVYHKHPTSAINYDCWVEVWSEETQLKEYWKPDVQQ